METIEQKELKVKEKVAGAKRTVAKKSKPKPAEASPISGDVKPPEQVKPKKKREPKKPVSPAEWLDKYISQGEQTTSGAKLCTYLLTRKEGADIQEIIQRCSEIASMKQSGWGKTSSSIKGHLRFLKQKGLQVEELIKDVFKVSA